MWNDFTLTLKLNILEVESTVLVGLLLDCNELMTKLRQGCSKQEALAIINEQF